MESAEKYPDHVAIYYRDQSITYKDLAKAVKETAATFAAKGIQPGDRVLIFVPMSIDLYRSVLALFYMGATAVFLDEWVSKKRMELCCKIADCKAFIGIFKARVFAFFSKELKQIPIKLGTKYSKGTELDIYNANAEDTALITFTTGSTGTPKAAKRTHGFLREQFNALLEKIDPQPHDIDMPVLPIVLLCNLGVGASSVIAEFKASKPDSLKPEKIVQQIQQLSINRITASPFFIKVLAAHVKSLSANTVQLEKIFTGGAPVFPAEAQLYNEAFPTTRIEVVYGSTEAEPISSIDTKALVLEKERMLEKGLKVGMPYHKISIKIIGITDEIITCSDLNELQKLEVEQGQPGEIIVAGNHVLKEYYNNQEAWKRNKIVVGDQIWHRTGDGGYLDEGFLYLLGRCSRVIESEQGNIFPFIVENYLQSIENVQIGTVLKVNDKVIVAIEPATVHNNEAVTQAIEKLNIRYSEIHYTKQIPRDPRHNSKIDYDKLLEQLLEE
jgi:acyl-CoA synthetase (AMP-forming)/AMP-acid ligase II